jgi:3-hydroxybutyryl-CoA dehydrogenase
MGTSCWGDVAAASCVLVRRLSEKREYLVHRSRIGVIGGGLMGHGIAYLFAAAGHDVGIFEYSSEVRGTIRSRIESICALLGSDPALIGKIGIYHEMAPAVAGAELVIEAAPEKLTIKRELFSALEACAPRDAVFASNTSAIPITDIARELSRRERVVGAHFWNPPHLIRIVEVVQTEWSSDVTIERVMSLLKGASRIPVHCRRDVPGFIGNRLQHALKREAIAMLANGIADAETIDTVVKEGFGARLAVLGPLEQSDMVGLNLTLDIHETLIADLDRSMGPHPLLRRLVEEGKLGMKAGEGFRRWTPEQSNEVRERLVQYLAGLA